jgi:hypothetical protein
MAKIRTFLDPSWHDNIKKRKLRLCSLVGRGPGFDSRCYHISWEVVGLERGPLSLVSITEELLEFKSIGSGSIKPEIHGLVDPLRRPRDTLYQQKLTLTSLISGGRSVGILCLRAKATEFKFVFLIVFKVTFSSGSVWKEKLPFWHQLWSPCDNTWDHWKFGSR